MMNEETSELTPEDWEEIDDFNDWVDAQVEEEESFQALVEEMLEDAAERMSPEEVGKALLGIAMPDEQDEEQASAQEVSESPDAP